MKVKTVKGYECPGCDEFIMEDDLPKLVTHYQCGKCEEIYKDRDEAEECCKKNKKEEHTMNDQEQKDITPTPEQLEQDMHKLLYGPDILTPIPKRGKGRNELPQLRSNNKS